MKYLALYFDAPLQSYGIDGNFDDKTTLDFPSRSAITGILCASLGYEWDDERVARLAKLTFLTLDLSKRRRIITTDFNTVGGGRSSNAHYVKQANGKNHTSTIVQTKRFVSDSKFGAIIFGDDAQIEILSESLTNPVFGGWLGRKCCIPCVPVFQGVFNCTEDGVSALCGVVGIEKPRRIIRETVEVESYSTLLYDVPIRFSRECRNVDIDYISRRVVIE